MQCLVGKHCRDELLEWFDSRSGEGDYVCNAETAEFREACPGVWFGGE